MKILALAASQREQSLNRMLAQQACKLLAEQPNVEVTHLDYRALIAPPFDDGVHTASTLPPAALAFVDALTSHDALIIASPEYNWSMPGHLKNLIDWVSCLRPYPTLGIPTLLMSASPSRRGGLTGLTQLQTTLTSIGTLIYPQFYTLSQAHFLFDDSGLLHDSALTEEIESILKEFVMFAHTHTKV